jgi:hypothetical protein
MSSSFGYDMNTSEDGSNEMFGTLKKNQAIAKAQFDYLKPGEALKTQIRQGTEGFGISGSALKAIKGTKDVIQKAQAAKTAVTAAVNDVTTAGRNVQTTVNNAVGTVNRVAGLNIPSIPGNIPSIPGNIPSIPGLPSIPGNIPSIPGLPSIPGAAPAPGAAQGPKYGPTRAPLDTNMASSGNVNTDRSAIQGATQAQKAAVGDLDDAASSTIKSSIQAHPIAGRSLTGATTSEAFDTINARSSIINDGNDARFGLGGTPNNLRMGLYGHYTRQLGLNNTGGNAPGAANAHASPAGGVGADLGDAAEDLGKSGLSLGLETAGTVLDALGPIGDLLGVGMAIFGGIEGAKGQAGEIKSQARTQKIIDAPTQQTVVTKVSRTLDTSQGGSQPTSVHF